MWLPKNERKLLEIYWGAIQKYLKKIDSSPFKEKWYNIGNLVDVFQAKDFKRKAKMLKDVSEKAGKKDKTVDNTNNSELTVENVGRYLNGQAAVDVANASLSARRLIIIKPHQSMNNVIGVSLTIEGYDLGREYSGWWMRTGLWFREYRDHWIWLIVGFIGGIIGAIVIEVAKHFVYRSCS